MLLRYSSLARHGVTQHRHLLLRVLRVVLLLLVAAHSAPNVARAQQPDQQWSLPQRLSDDAVPYGNSLVTSDPLGCVHVTWTGNSLPDEKVTHDALYYSSWCDATWSEPVDILAVPFESRLDSWGLAADSFGAVVVLWSQDGALKLSEAPADKALSPHAWRTTDLAPGYRVTSAALFLDSQNVTHVLVVTENRLLLYLQVHPDENTGPVQMVAEAPDLDTAFVSPALAVKDGVVVALWNVYEEWNNWSPTALWYARSLDGGVTWESHQTLASGAGHGPGSIVFDHQGRLHVLWVGTLQLGGRYHRWSTDGGAHWSDTEVVALDLAGNTGGGSPLVDSSGVLHWVFGGLGADGEGVRHARWLDAAWSVHVLVSHDLPRSDSGVAALSQGHVIHAVWPELEQMVIYHAWYDTGSPPVAPEPPTPAPRATPTTPPRAIPTPASPVSERAEPGTAPTPNWAPSDQEVAAADTGAISWVFLAVGSPLVLLVAVTVFYSRSRKRRG